MNIYLSVTIFLLISLLLTLYYYVTRNNNYWKRLGVPYIKPVPFFGNTLDFLLLKKSFYTILKEIHDSSSNNYIGIYMLDGPSLLIREPNLIKQILIRDFDYFSDRFPKINDKDKISSNLMFFAKSDLWRVMRGKISPIFTSSKIRRMLPLILQVSEDMKDYIKNDALSSEHGCVKKIGMKYMTDVISSCAFGINARSFKDEDALFCKAVARCFEPNIDRALSMTAYFIAPKLTRIFNLKMVEPIAGGMLKDIFWKYLNDREASKTSRGDLIDLLIELKKEESDEDVIVTQAIQFLFAGFDTTGVALSLILYSVAKHRVVQDRARREIGEIVKRHGSISYEALKEMKYLDCVIDETLRLYPVFPFLNRVCVKPYRIPGTDLVLQKGMGVYVSLLGLHYDSHYFPNPREFDPERFSEENKANITPATYMPFGDGPRNCIGINFALMTLKVAIVQILSEFQISTGNTTAGPLEFGTKSLMLAPTSDQLDFHFERIKR